MLHKYELEIPNNLEEFWTVCETLKQNGVLPYGANSDFGLGVPAMCAGLYDIYQSDEADQLLNDLSEGITPVSTYMENGFSFVEEMIKNGYLDPEQALNTLPSSEEETRFFADENCAFISALDSIAKDLGKISSSKNATAPDIPESNDIISYVARGKQIPNQDFRLRFNVWNNVKELSLKVCQGTSPEDAAAEYDKRQAAEIKAYGK